MLLNNTVRTFPCPRCGAILSTGVTSCDVCSAPLNAEAVEAAAERREQILKANGEANSLVLSARMFLPAFGLSFLPFLSPVGAAGVVILLLQVPFLAFRWYHRHGKLEAPEPELAEARRWWKEAVAIWVVTLLLTPVWYWLRYGGR